MLYIGAKIIQKDKVDINSLFDQNKLAQKGVTKFSTNCCTLINSKVDTGWTTWVKTTSAGLTQLK